MRFLTIALLVVITCASCGGSDASRAGSVQQSLASLQHALRVHHARTACELIFPYGRDLPEAGLQKALRAVDTESGRTKYEASVSGCANSWRPDDFAAWQQLIGTLSVVSVKTHGDIAVARLTPRYGALTFVKAAGEWRLLFRSA